MDIIGILVVIAFSIVIFLLLREFNCWYFKFNEMLAVQKEILAHLKVSQTEQQKDVSGKTEKSYMENISEQEE